MALPSYDELVGKKIPTYEELTARPPTYEELTSGSSAASPDSTSAALKSADAEGFFGVQSDAPVKDDLNQFMSKSVDPDAMQPTGTKPIPLLALTSSAKARHDEAAATGYRIPSLTEAAMTTALHPVPNMDSERAGQWAQVADVSGLSKLVPKETVDRLSGIGENVLADTVNFMVGSPAGIATIGIGALPKTAQGVVSAAFLANAIHETPENYRAIRDAKTPEELDKAITGTVENMMVLGGSGAHFLSEARAASRPASLPQEAIDAATARRPVPVAEPPAEKAIPVAPDAATAEPPSTPAKAETPAPPTVAPTAQSTTTVSDVPSAKVEADLKTIKDEAKAWNEIANMKKPENRPPIPESASSITEGTVVRSDVYRGEGEIKILGPVEVVNKRLVYPASFTGTGRSGFIEANHISEVLSRPEKTVTDIPSPEPITPEAPKPEPLTAGKTVDTGLVAAPITADAAAKAFQPHLKAAEEAARRAGAPDPELAASTAWTELTDAATEGKITLDNPAALLAERARQRGLDQQRPAAASVANVPEDAPQLKASTPSPAAAAIESDFTRRVRETVDSLPENQRETAQMMLDGKSVAEIAESQGVTESAVYQRLKAIGPKMKSLREEMNDSWTSATEDRESATKTMRRGGKETGAIKMPQFPNRKMSPLDRTTTERSAKLQKSFDEASRAKKQIQKAIPSQKRQNAVSVWMEADGDMATLKSWEMGAKGDVFKRAAKDAQSLTPEEIAIAKRAKQAFEVLAQRGGKYDVLKNARDNYVPHVWEVEKKGGFGGGRLQERFKFSKARTFANFAEGDAAGFKPKTLAIGKLLPAYLSEMNKVIADRQFVQDLAKETAKDGRPLVVPRGRISEISTQGGDKAYLANPDAIKGLKDAQGNPVDTSDYKTMEGQPALHDWRWEGKDADGNPIFMRDDLAVHPEAAKRINSMLGKSAIREWYNEPSEGAAQIPKAVIKGLDTAQSVMKREMFGLLAPFHQVQEGWHGIAHKINPFFDIPKVDLREPAQMDAAKHGLMILPDRTSAQSYMEGLGGRGTFLSQASRFLGEKADEKLVGKAATALADVIDGYQSYLFHQYIPGLKFKTYEEIRTRNTKLYDKEIRNGELTESDVKLLSAEQTNAAYGHLNYALLDRNPTMQHIIQMIALAPDFLEARGKFTAQAAKGMLGSKRGVEQFKALATIAAVQAGIAYTLTKLGGDEWDPKHPFEVVHGDRRYTLRSVPEDIASLVMEPRQFIYGRVNPLIVKGGVQLATGLNYRGEKTTPTETLEELGAQYIPITARSLPGIRELTETSRKNPVSPVEQLMGSLGLRISRKSPISETYKLASEWMEKEKLPKDKGSYPVSKYQQLRYALEDGDISKAQEEYDLLKKDAPAAKIGQGFRESVNHPFTGSAASDRKFRDSLNAEDRAKFDLAVQKRKEIQQRFGLWLR